MSKKKEQLSTEAPDKAKADEKNAAESPVFEKEPDDNQSAVEADLKKEENEPSDIESSKADGEKPRDEKSSEEIIDELKNEIKAAGDRYLRLMAEFDNYKKRTAREFDRIVESANEKLMTELIGVRETFELAIKHGEKGSDYGQLFEGIKLLFNKFDAVLTANGLTPFASIGEPFDPQIHDALMKMPHNEIPENHIAGIHEKGYRLKNRVIKHAKVIISSGKHQETTSTISSNNDDKPDQPTEGAAT